MADYFPPGTKRCDALVEIGDVGSGELRTMVSKIEPGETVDDYLKHLQDAIDIWNKRYPEDEGEKQARVIVPVWKEYT